MCHEDSDVCIRVCRTGRNQTMRHLGRTHGITIAWLHEQYKAGAYSLEYEPSASMAADIFTKSFSNPLAFDAVCWLVFVCSAADLVRFYALGGVPPPPPQGGPRLASGTSSLMVPAHGPVLIDQPSGAAHSSRPARPAVRYTSVSPWTPTQVKCYTRSRGTKTPRYSTRSSRHRYPGPSSPFFAFAPPLPRYLNTPGSKARRRRRPDRGWSIWTNCDMPGCVMASIGPPGRRYAAVERLA